MDEKIIVEKGKIIAKWRKISVRSGMKIVDEDRILKNDK